MNELFRPLTERDRDQIEAVLTSRSDQVIVGVNWTAGAIVQELGSSRSIAYVPEYIESFILYKVMGDILEILLIYSKKGSRQAGEVILRALIDSHSQAREIWLEVHEDNHQAVHFYECHGFRRVSLRLGYYPDGKSAVNYSLTLAHSSIS